MSKKYIPQTQKHFEKRKADIQATVPISNIWRNSPQNIALAEELRNTLSTEDKRILWQRMLNLVVRVNVIGGIELEMGTIGTITKITTFTDHPLEHFYRLYTEETGNEPTTYFKAVIVISKQLSDMLLLFMLYLRLTYGVKQLLEVLPVIFVNDMLDDLKLFSKFYIDINGKTPIQDIGEFYLGDLSKELEEVPTWMVV